MLDASVAGMIACPANADDAVKERIISHGGYVAKKEVSMGVTEALKHFLL